MPLEFTHWPDQAIVNSLADAVRSKKLCILTGSAVSCFSPSCLPDGKILRESLLEGLAHPKGITTTELDDLERITLEQILQEIEWAHCKNTLQWLSQQLLGSGNSTFRHNALHSAIAEICAQYHVPLITTNFDLLHESGILEQSGLEAEVIAEEDTALARLKSLPFLNPAGNMVLKLHGTLSSTKSMRATLGRVGSALPPNLSRLAGTAMNEKLLLVLGYSGSDPDIAPLLLDSLHSGIVWVVHPSGTTNPATWRLGAYGKQVMQSREGFVIAAEASEFLNALHQLLIGENQVSSQLRATKWRVDAANSRSHWQSWAKSEQVARRRIALARLYIAVPLPSYALNVLSASDPTDNNIIQAHTLWLKCKAMSLADNYTDAVRTAKQCRDILLSMDDKLGVLECSRELAHQNRMIGGWRFLNAILLFKRVLRNARLLGGHEQSDVVETSKETLICETILGLVGTENQLTAYLPAFKGAVSSGRIAILKEALITQEKIGGLDLRGNLLRHQGTALTFLGKYYEARMAFKEAQLIFEGLGRYRTGVVNTLQGVAYMYFHQGRVLNVIRVSRSAVRLAGKEGGLAGRAKHCRLLAIAYLSIGRTRRAIYWLREMRSTGSMLPGTWNMLNFGHLSTFGLIAIAAASLKCRIKKQPTTV